MFSIVLTLSVVHNKKGSNTLSIGFSRTGVGHDLGTLFGPPHGTRVEVINMEERVPFFVPEFTHPFSVNTNQQPN